MSTAFFNRIARISIGTLTSSNTLRPLCVINTPLRITFEVVKTEFSIMNEATVTINNLSTHTQAIIKRKLFLILEAGYVDAGGLRTMFHGEIVDVSSNQKKPEVLTTINIQDGHTAIKKAGVSLSYRTGTPIRQIINDAANALGLPKNSTYSYVRLPTTAIEGPFAYTGTASVLLDQLCAEHGLQWSIQNGLFKIYNAGHTDNLPPRKAVLIGSPRRLFKNQLSVSLEDFDGYELDCTLLPELEPGNGITFSSLEVQKPITLQVAEVKHIGDFYADKWMTTAKARDI